jgi:hypothetical protein
MLRWFSTNPQSEESIFAEQMKVEADGSFIVQMNNYTIPQDETTYHYKCLYRDEVLAQGVPNKDRMTFIGFRAIWNPATVKYVHHVIVYGRPGSDESEVCKDAIYLTYITGWGPGEAPYRLPENVGFPFGPGIFSSFQLEVHYNNVDHDADIVDDFGFEFFYTETPREIEAGVLVLGDPQVNMEPNPVGDGLVEATFHCSGGCSKWVLPQPVTVFREFLHMHNAGISTHTQLIRDDQVEQTAVINYFDFMQTGAPPMQQKPFTVLPGDAFKTSCIYNSAPGRNLTYGHSSQSEMCVTFLWYYPRQEIFGYPWACVYGMGQTDCDAKFTSRTLSSTAEVYRTFGTPSDQCMDSDTNDSSDTSRSSKDSTQSSSSVVFASASFILHFVAFLVIGFSLH